MRFNQHYQLAAPLLALALISCASVQSGGSLQGAAQTLDVANTRSLSFAATGHWYQFGQAPAPGLAWPQFDVSRYQADVNYDSASARVQITRKQVVEASRARPAPSEQRVDQYVSGDYAWSLPVAPGANLPTPQPNALEERRAEIWATPQGFVKAALANQASSRSTAQGTEVSFTVGGKHRYVGLINSRNQVERVLTWIDNPVLGDTPVETCFADYRDFGGLQFPARITRSTGGHPSLELTVSTVQRNPVVTVAAPAEVVNPKPAAITVTATHIADGVFYLTGGTHHSVAIEQQDHVVLVEAPQTEARSLAVLEKLREVVRNKPVRYVVNTHVHFDHSGGLRTLADAGAIVVTAQANRPFYEQAWSAPRTLNPDKLALSKKPVRFETVGSKHVLSDGKRSIEIHTLTGNGHNDAFAVVYLPAEKLLVQADAWTPGPANAPLAGPPNPFTVNLYENIQRLKLDVATIAALHGPRLTTLGDLKTAASGN